MDSLRQQTDFQERIIDRTFEENPSIKDLGDFKDALINAFDTERGRRASKWFNDDEIKFLFETSFCKDKIRENISEKEYQRLYEEIKEDEVEFQRELPRGEIIKPKQIDVVYTPKTISVKSSSRAGKPIKAYSKGYSKWTSAEIRFLSVRKAQKLTPKKIITQYNEHFQEKQRPTSSIKSKIYRL